MSTTRTELTVADLAILPTPRAASILSLSRSANTAAVGGTPETLFVSRDSQLFDFVFILIPIYITTDQYVPHLSYEQFTCVPRQNNGADEARLTQATPAVQQQPKHITLNFAQPRSNHTHPSTP